jgi:2-iminoacetate synthase
MQLEDFPHLVDDAMFKRIVAVLRLALPFTGLILSTRETSSMRQEVLRYGVSQVSAGSCTGVGGYLASKEGQSQTQFSVGDHRDPLEVLKSLMLDGHIPSYCTACYRSGRTGDRFMALAKSGQIHNVCQPNALMTLLEFMMDYGDEALVAQGEQVIADGIQNVPNEKIRLELIEKLDRIRHGERDLFM